MAMEIFKLVGSVFVDTDAADKSLQKTDKNAQNFGTTLLNGIGTAAKWAAGIAAATATAATAAASALAVSSVKSYAEYEQLVGGVETLFGDSADIVLEYAEKAYKTAGMTANEYMETVTSFTASLLQGLGGDTEAAAQIADMAITDMADNANKFGSDLSSIQNAYQGFAKQNYTMLDNLKLGYGGTKTEMERLLADAQALSGVEYSIDNLNDVYEAIHVIQTEMGVTGTTAEEAESTISGAVAMVKSRLENFKNEIGEALAPVVKEFLAKVIENLPTIQGYVEELVPFLTDFVASLLDWLPDIFAFIESLAPLVSDLLVVAKDGLTGLAEILQVVVYGFMDAVTWGREHQTALELIAIAVGTVATAIGLYTLAENLKNIAVQAGVAAEGSATVAMGLHTVATNIATAASTAFGTVMAFITSPITLVVLAIGALIAIVVLMVKHWDELKEAALKCWAEIQEIWSKVADWFDENVIQPIAAFFRNLWEKITGIFQSVIDWVKDNWVSIALFIINPFAGVFSYLYKNCEGFRNFFLNLWNGIKTVFSNVGTWFTNIFTGAVKGVKNAWSGIKDWFRSLLDGVKSVFSNVATAVGNIFKAPINTIIKGINAFISGINQIKIPDWVPAVGGKGFNISPISYLEQGGVLEKGQVGLLEGNGAEAVVPLEKNQKWISAVAQDMDSAIGGASDDRVVTVLTDILEVLEAMAEASDSLDSTTVIRALVNLLAKPMDKELGKIQAQKARV